MPTAPRVPPPDDMFAMAEAVRARGPLVHNITNYVAMTFSANVLLAAGASPAMVHAEAEAADFARIAAALVINIGTLSPPWVAAMEAAAGAANADGKPWVLDPVGCGATAFRTETAARLAALKPTLIRGNASEILSLAGAAGAAPKGVDSALGSEAALEAAAALAARTGGVVAVTGATDYVVGPGGLLAIEAGDAMMARSTATGCALSALCGAYLAVGSDAVAATAAAVAVYGVAGAAAARAGRGPGDLPAGICNALAEMDAAAIAAGARLRAEAGR